MHFLFLFAVCDVDAKYRTIDGSCNNLKNGKRVSNTFFKRLPDENENNVIDYADGKNIKSYVCRTIFFFF